jgi:hypothetical protein
MTRRKLLGLASAASITIVVGSSCGDAPPGRTYYERVVEPILVQSCSGGTSGCHAANDDDPYQFAAGNLDVTSFERLQKRRDLLEPHGVYGYPLLLVKAVGPGALPLVYGDVDRDLDVVHAGGPIFEVNSDAFLTLLSWTANGATETGLRPPTPSVPSEGACNSAVPAGFDPAPYLAHPQFGAFVDEVQPRLAGCALGNCHGAPQSDFMQTCGDDDTQRAFNFARAQDFVADDVDESQLLSVPLAVGAGGGPHTGGDYFASREDPTYLAIRAWAEEVGAVRFGEGEPAKEFYRDHVEPMLLARGCAFQGCHSPQSANDFKLRAGSANMLAAASSERNYDLLRNEFMTVEFPDARRGRAVSKTVAARDGGIGHRGGALLLTAGGERPDPATCPDVYDPATATRFCTVQRWLDLEREELLAAGEISPMDEGATLPLVYVERATTHLAGPLDVDTYQPGSDLLVAPVTLGPGQALASVGAATSLLGDCAGVDPATADVRGPEFRLDGETLAFAMRTSAADPFGIWTVRVDGSGCTRVTPAAPAQGGIAIHNLDPTWSPDGEFLVFASTRGASGPTLSRKRLAPQTDLWRMRRDGSDLEQLTFLTNSEVNPQFIREGRMIMTTEKVSQGFYQLAGRRLNWDRTDYHPLLAQRATSRYASLDPDSLDAELPSVDYAQATDVREQTNGDFLVIFSDEGARGGAGALGLFNRSVGPSEAGRSDSDPGYLTSMSLLDPAASGRVGEPSNGAYRAPFGLPSGDILVSYATGFAGDLGAATSFDWDLAVVDPRTGARTILLGGAGAQTDAVLGFRQPVRRTFLNKRQLVFGGGLDQSLDDDQALVHMPDAPMIFTLLTGNLRRGRPVDAFRRATHLAVYLEEPAPPGAIANAGGIFESRRLLGRAPLATDGSARVVLPAGRGLVLALEDASGGTVVTMTEEHQLGPAESISLGIREPFFNAACGGCHGSVSGSELDVAVSPDVLTGASQSRSKDAPPLVVSD